MIKPFEFIKVFSVCTVPNARNTRRSTAFRRNPSYLVLCQIPRAVQTPPQIQSLLGVAVACREEVCIIVYPVSLFSTVFFAACTVRQLLLPLCRVFPNSFSGIGRPGGNPSFEKGGKVFFFEVPKSFAAISNNQETKRETSSGGHREYGRKKGLWCILHNVTVT